MKSKTPSALWRDLALAHRQDLESRQKQPLFVKAMVNILSRGLLDLANRH